MFKECENEQKMVLYDHGRKEFENFLRGEMKMPNIEEWKIDTLLQPFQEMKSGNVNLNYKRMLETFKNRHKLTSAFPVANSGGSLGRM